MIEQSPPPRIQPRPALSTRSVLWVLAIGISRYQEPALALQYASLDARAVAEALQQQDRGTIYAETRTRVLVDAEASRESILTAIEKLQSEVGPNDVAVLFMAGHGVREPTGGSFYFLPYAANGTNLLTQGLRLSDFDESMRLLRRRVRAVALMLDTCHSGALRLGGGVAAADDLAVRMSSGDGVYLLAASSAGEESVEQPSLEHGVFTAALLNGLAGAADRNADEIVSISELFGYVAHEVPRLTGNTQHPYSKMEGTDLAFASVAGGSRSIHIPSQSGPVPDAPQPAVENSVGVMQFRDLRSNTSNDWIGKALRIAFNTELSKVKALRVYSPEIIDRTASELRTDDLATANELHIEKAFTGSFHVSGGKIRIDAQIIDASSGVQEGSDSVQGPLDDFLGLQKELVLSMLKRLPVQVTAGEQASIEAPAGRDVDAYRLLLEAEGIVEESNSRAETTPSASTTPYRESFLPDVTNTLSWIHGLVVTTAHAEEPTHIVRNHEAQPAGLSDPMELEVLDALEQFRQALQRKDIEALSRIYASYTPRQREAQKAYFESADALTVEFNEIRIERRASEYAVSYTRLDRLTDHKTGRSVPPLPVRLTKFFVKEGNQWKIVH